MRRIDCVEKPVWWHLVLSLYVRSPRWFLCNALSFVVAPLCLVMFLHVVLSILCLA